MGVFNATNARIPFLYATNARMGVLNATKARMLFVSRRHEWVLEVVNRIVTLQLGVFV
jgi:hypothetical protein